MKSKLTVFLFISLFFILSSAIHSQNAVEGFGAGNEFQADLAWFKSADTGLIRLEVYYKIFNTDLQFIKEGNGYRAGYEISVVAYDSKNHPVDSRSRERKFTINSYDRTMSYNDYRTSQIDLVLPAGKYKIECILRDLNSGEKATRTLKTELNKFDSENPQLSGIEFVQSSDTAVLDSVFLKGNRMVIPSVARIYGGDSTSALLYYQEIYQGQDKKESIKMETQILDSKHDAVYRDTLTATFSDGIIRQLRQASLAGMRAGVYTLEVILKGRRDRIIQDMTEEFRIYWSPEALVKNDFNAAVDQLKYIATPSELKKIKNAPTMEEKIKQWNLFWSTHDPTSGTGRNELKEDYYRRIEIANARYSRLKKPGWLTDRGMIYIEYGEPDQIEDYPFEMDQKAYQIWYYYSIGVPRRFLFIDEWGDGDYRLQYPYDGIVD